MGDIKKFVNSISLEDVFLKSQSGECHVSPRILDPSRVNLNFDFKAGFEKIENDKIFLVIASLEVIAVDKETNEPQFEVFSEYVLAYDYSRFSDQLTEKLSQAFARTTGLFNAYPYLREAIQTMTSKMGIPPVVAPLLKIEPPKAKPQEEVNKDIIVKKKKSKARKKST